MQRLTPHNWWPMTWQQYKRLFSDRMPEKRLLEQFIREHNEYNEMLLLLQLREAKIAEQNRINQVLSQKAAASSGAQRTLKDGYMEGDYVDEDYVELGDHY